MTDLVLIGSVSVLFSYVFSLEVTPTNTNWQVALLFIIKKEYFWYKNGSVCFNLYTCIICSRTIIKMLR
jgi:hypothetical protein